MLAVLFEVIPLPGQAPRYFEIAATLRERLNVIDGFISVERFESLTRPGVYLSLSYWRDEARHCRLAQRSLPPRRAGPGPRGRVRRLPHPGGVGGA